MKALNKVELNRDTSPAQKTDVVVSALLTL